MGLPSHPPRAVSSYHLRLRDFLRAQLLVRNYCPHLVDSGPSAVEATPQEIDD